MSAWYKQIIGQIRIQIFFPLLFSFISYLSFTSPFFIVPAINSTQQLFTARERCLLFMNKKYSQYTNLPRWYILQKTIIIQQRKSLKLVKINVFWVRNTHFLEQLQKWHNRSVFWDFLTALFSKVRIFVTSLPVKWLQKYICHFSRFSQSFFRIVFCISLFFCVQKPSPVRSSTHTQITYHEDQFLSLDPSLRWSFVYYHWLSCHPLLFHCRPDLSRRCMSLTLLYRSWFTLFSWVTLLIFTNL